MKRKKTFENGKNYTIKPFSFEIDWFNWVFSYCVGGNEHVWHFTTLFNAKLTLKIDGLHPYQVATNVSTFSLFSLIYHLPIVIRYSTEFSVKTCTKWLALPK